MSNVALFPGDDGIYGVELWISDSSGTHIVADLNPGTADSNPS